ncbi:MAG: signal peptidase bacterial type [Chthonomonadales bacterium]|nr:signal peptidase bacterial type [Chthonomonadales bacterium]
MPTIDITGTTDAPKPRVLPRRRLSPRRMAFLFAVLMFLVVLMLVFSTDFIPSKSMQPTLEPGDHVIALRAWFAYPMNAMPARGDIITFRIPIAKLDDADEGKPANTEGSDDPEEKATFFSFFKSHAGTEVLIKRVIGLPGDKVLIKGGRVYINGVILPEKYKTIPPDYEAMGEYAVIKPLVIPQGELFVLGDNRNNSDDGRFWGTLKRKYIIGKFVHNLYNEGEKGPNVLRAQSEE